MESDVCVFAFDGTDLDSGSVVEFMATKFLDIPAVIYRTDFRGGSGEEPLVGTKNSAGDEHCYKWNLMCSFYPRTKVLYLNSMVEYQKIYTANQDKSALEISQLYSEELAKQILAAMDEVMTTPTITSPERSVILREEFYKLMDIENKKGCQLIEGD